MMHEEYERPPNEKSHAYHFSITYNGCDFCWHLLQFLLYPDAYLKVLWIFKNIFETLHDLNDSDEKTRMLKTAS